MSCKGYITDMEQILTVQETLSVLKVSRTQLYRLIWAGRLTRVRYQALPGKVFFLAEDVKKLQIVGYQIGIPNSIVGAPRQIEDTPEEPIQYDPEVLLIQ